MNNDPINQAAQNRNFSIRILDPTDAQGLTDLYSDKEVYSQMLHLPDTPLYKWEKNLANIPDNVHAYVALLGDEIVGNISLVVETTPRRRNVASLAIAVKYGYEGKGIGSALMTFSISLADKWLDLKRIELTVFNDNARAIELYRKYGFVIEGEAKAFAFRDGQYATAYYMARIKENI